VSFPFSLRQFPPNRKVEHGILISTVNPQRIAELLTPFLARQASEEAAAGENRLSAEQVQQISMYIDLLLHWNARVNLTAIRTPDQVVTRHFGESLFAARHLPLTRIDEPGRPRFAPSAGANLGSTSLSLSTSLSSRDRLIDIGSGAGFPGIPIKIWSPTTPVTLIESNQKKVAFLREVIRALTLTDINVLHARAEDHPGAAARIVTLRAVERFDKILPVAARLLTSGGTLALLIGSSQLAEAQRSLPSFSWSKPAPIPLSSNRILACGKANQEESR
jgi:16S rRNA (guanine527-N7)-methyltransferase